MDPNIDHLNPSRLKIPYYLCNNRKQFQSRTNPTHPTQPSYHYPYSQQPHLTSNTYNCHDSLYDQNNSLRQQLQQLKKYNTYLRKKLQNKDKELETTDRDFKETLVKYNKRLETSNSEMAKLLIEESRDYYKEVEKSRSRSKERLVQLKNQLGRIDCGEIRKMCGKEKERR